VDDVSGASYVVFGSGEGFSSSLDLGALDGTNGFRLDGVDGFDASGFSVAGAGDVNGDGIDDLIVGAPRTDPVSTYQAGESYVVFGTDTGFAPSLDLAALDGSNGFRLDGDDARSYSGLSVGAAGDVTGDGIDDLIIGAPGSGVLNTSGISASYVVFGTTAGFTASLDLASLDGSNGFRLDGVDPFDLSGGSVAGAGDFNGDGFDDLIIGAYRAGDVPGAGETYVVFGTDAGFAASFDLAALDGSNGFRLDGSGMFDGSGRSVAGVGDVNGDGFDDLIVGAPSADPGGRLQAGQSYVVFGFAGEPKTPIFGTPCRDILTGTDASESFHPGGGRDFITTGDGEDTIFFDDRPGKRDVLKIADFDPLADTLDLRGATVAETRDCHARTVLLLDGPDCDTIVLLGISEPPLDLF
jgi:hypothetical protein